jgi:hypothetical protein
MRRLLIFSLPFLVMSPVSAREITHTIVDSVQLTVDGPALQTERIGGQYSVSGSNINATTIGGFDATFTHGAPDHVNGVYAIGTNNQSFTFSESITLGDTIVTDQTALTSGGRIDEPVLYGDSTQYQGGTAGSLAGTLSATGIPTVTAGGAGTTAIGQRSIELSVFK